MPPSAISALLLVLLALLAPPAQAAEAQSAHLLEVTGRLAARRTEVHATEREPATELEIRRARVELDYRYQKLLRAVLEVDGGEGFELRDAFVRVGRKALAVRVGQFKPPLSGMELVSSWRLPLARRGLVHNALVDHLRFAGRRPGVQLEWRGEPAWKPQLTAGAFQGSDGAGRLFRTVGVLQTNLLARASVEPGRSELGASAALVGTEAFAGIGIGRYWIAALDASTRARLGPVRLRGWGEAMYGTSFYGTGALGRDTPFVGGRLLVAGRLWGSRTDAPYVELFAQAEQLRFDVAVEDSELRGYVVGLNTGFWDRFRLTLQAEQRRAGARSPYLSAGGNQLRDRTVYLVQLESRLSARWRP
jgi:hypothetical protein